MDLVLDGSQEGKDLDCKVPEGTRDSIPFALGEEVGSGDLGERDRARK